MPLHLSRTECCAHAAAATAGAAVLPIEGEVSPQQPARLSNIAGSPQPITFASLAADCPRQLTLAARIIKTRPSMCQHRVFPNVRLIARPGCSVVSLNRHATHRGST